MNLENLSQEQLITIAGGNDSISLPGGTAGVYDNGDGNGCIPPLYPQWPYQPKSIISF